MLGTAIIAFLSRSFSLLQFELYSEKRKSQRRARGRVEEIVDIVFITTNGKSGRTSPSITLDELRNNEPSFAGKSYARRRL